MLQFQGDLYASWLTFSTLLVCLIYISQLNCAMASSIANGIQETGESCFHCCYSWFLVQNLNDTCNDEFSWAGHLIVCNFPSHCLMFLLPCCTVLRTFKTGAFNVLVEMRQFLLLRVHAVLCSAPPESFPANKSNLYRNHSTVYKYCITLFFRTSK